MKLPRVWHPVAKWEEMETSMWLDAGSFAIERSIQFTSNHILYGEYMGRVFVEWPISCENSLTNYNINRKAWLGHAACALAIDCPQVVTRKAWAFLSDSQRALANREAARHIGLWEDTYIQGRGVRSDLAQKVLF